jgi:hypothetical protein
VKHLEDINETYLEHLWFAVSVAFVFIVHGLLPWVWKTKGTDMIRVKEIERQKNKGA